jgi:hypothetical protein
MCLALAMAVQAQNLIVYDDALENGWQDGGSWATVNYANTSPVYNSSDSISVVDPTTTYEALWLYHDPFDTSPYQSLSFWVYPTVAATGQIVVFATTNYTAIYPGQAITFTAAQTGAWQQVTISLSSLGVATNGNFDGVILQNYYGNPQTFYLDGISFVAIPPPASIQLTATAPSVVRTIDSRMYGINADIWDPQLETSATATSVVAMQTQVMRFPAGGDSDEYNWQTDESITNSGYKWASSVATFATVASTTGAQAYTIVNYGDGTPEQAAAWVAYYNGATNNTATIGVDSMGRNWQTVGYWATIRASAPLPTDDGYNFLRLSHPAAYGFRYWEVGNEVYGSWDYDQHGVAGSGLTGAPHDAYTYANAFPAFVSKMKAVDPTINVGIDGYPGEDAYGNGTHAVPNPNEGNSLHSGWTAVVLATLKSLAVTPDFIVDHIYPENPGSECDSVLLQSGGQIGSQAANVRKMVTDYVGGAAGAGIELDVTELNSVITFPGKQSVSLVNGLFMADAVGQLANTEFNSCLWWDFRNGSETSNNNSSSLYGWRQFGDYGILASGDLPDTPVNTPYPTFYAAKLLTHWGRGGDRVVSAVSNYAWLSFYAATLANGSLALLVVNKHSASNLTAQVTLTGFTPGTNTATSYSYGKPNDLANSDLTSGSFNSGTGTFSYTFPSYSMTVLVIDGQWEAWREQNFTAAQLTNSAISGDTATPAHDGVPNLLKYALGLSPMVSASPSSLPVVSTLSSNGTNYLTLSFTQLQILADITYTVQVSNDLQTWNSGPAYAIRVDNGTTSHAVYQDLTPMGSTPRQFMRLMITRP